MNMDHMVRKNSMIDHLIKACGTLILMASASGICLMLIVRKLGVTGSNRNDR